MKRYTMMSPITGFAAAIFLTATLLIAGWANAQDEDPAPVSVHVTFSKAEYNLDDPNENIGAVITLRNISESDVYTKNGFSELGYHLYLYFYGPLGNDPKLIRAISDKGAGSTTPPVPPIKESLEKLLGPNDPWFINMDIVELRDYYPLAQPGRYKVWFSMPFIQYDPQQVEEVYDDDNTTIIGYVAPPDAVIWTDPIDTQETYITLANIVPPVTSDIKVMATEYTFGEGPRPGMTKKPLTGVQVRLYETSAIENKGISKISYKTYTDIVTNFTISFRSPDENNTAGEFIFRSVEQSDYVVIAFAASVTDYKHIGSPATISADDPSWGNSEIVRELILLTNYRGKKTPGKSMKVTGSELLIIQPEYVEWSTNQELYPIGFESLGDWNVEVSLEPPAGFVADQTSLSESVSSESKALQFTITDVGSEWKPTKVKYKVKHKKKTQEIYDEIGVKLTRKLAEEMGIDEWGEVLQEEKQEEHEETQEKKQEGKSKKGGKK